jgi:hypothetical protein
MFLNCTQNYSIQVYTLTVQTDRPYFCGHFDILFAFFLIKNEIDMNFLSLQYFL